MLATVSAVSAVSTAPAARHAGRIPTPDLPLASAPSALDRLPTELLLNLMDRYLDLPSLACLRRADRRADACGALLGADFDQASQAHRELRALFAQPKAAQPADCDRAASATAAALAGLAAPRAGIARAAWRKLSRTLVADTSAEVPAAQRMRLIDALLADLRRLPPGRDHDRQVQELGSVLAGWKAPAGGERWLVAAVAALLAQLPAASPATATACGPALMGRLAVPLCTMQFGSGLRDGAAFLRSLLDQLARWPDRQAAGACVAALRTRLQHLPRAPVLERMLDEAAARPE